MKKFINKFVIAAVAAAALTGTTACTDSFEAINTDPDGAQVVPSDNQLAWVLYFTSASFYDRWFMLDEPCTFAGYVSKAAYIDESKYQFRAGVQDSNWQYLYRILNNIRTIQAQMPETSNAAYIANIMEAHVMQIATDRWRDVPYSEACKMGEGYLTPKYDKQEDIYPALLDLLKRTADNMANNPGNDNVTGGDIMFGGDMDMWQRYCNSLRLRLAIRLSEVSKSLAQSTIEEVLGNPEKYPIIENNDQNAMFNWLSTNSNYYEPIADAWRTRKSEFCAPDIMVDYMKENADPRLGVYFNPTANSVENVKDFKKDYQLAEYAGHGIGEAQGPAKGIASVSVWGYKYGQDLGGVSPWMRSSEVMFYIAEAKFLGYNIGNYAESVEDAYNKAVRLSLEENLTRSGSTPVFHWYVKTEKGTDIYVDSDQTWENDNIPNMIEGYLNGAGKFNGTIDQIWYEEWVAMFKQGMEGWSLYRRTGVPKTNHIANGRAEKYRDHNVPPFRSPYPDKERDLNGDNNAPFGANVKDDFWGQQMWWDTRVGVY